LTFSAFAWIAWRRCAANWCNKVGAKLLRTIKRQNLIVRLESLVLGNTVVINQHRWKMLASPHLLTDLPNNPMTALAYSPCGELLSTPPLFTRSQNN
jgi:hypothetical protein